MQRSPRTVLFMPVAVVVSVSDQPCTILPPTTTYMENRLREVEDIIEPIMMTSEHQLPDRPQGFRDIPTVEAFATAQGDRCSAASGSGGSGGGGGACLTASPPGDCGDKDGDARFAEVVKAAEVCRTTMSPAGAGGRVEDLDCALSLCMVDETSVFVVLLVDVCILRRAREKEEFDCHVFIFRAVSCRLYET